MWYSINNIPSEIIAPDRPMLVAYANLLEDYGWPLSVLEAYDILSAGGAYALNWQSGDRIDGLRLSQDSEQPGWPMVDPAIVIFEVGGDRLPCYVADLEKHTIVDTLDGQIKPGSVYGKPVGWASFVDPRPPETPPKPVLKGAHTSSLVDGIAYESLGKVKRMYVCRPEGTELTDFSGYISTFRDFVGVPNSHLAYGDEVRVIGKATHPVLPVGQDFWMTLDDWGDFGRTGSPVRLHGYVRDHLSEQKPPALSPKVKPAAAPVPDETPAWDLAKDRAWEKAVVPDLSSTFNYLRTDFQPVRYRVMQDMEVRDYGTDQLKVTKVPKGITIAIYGTFWCDGEQYLLPRLDDPKIGIFDYWFGIPEFDELGNKNVEQIPDVTETLPVHADPPAAEPVVRRRRGVDDIIVNVSTLLEVALVRGVVKLKHHVERIRQWK